MAYEHDIFVSYRREVQWTPWVRDHLKVLLQSYLQQELGSSPDIFVDERIDVGADWVDELGEHLAKSKVVLAVFSRDYFDSCWCVHELDLILARIQSTTLAGSKPRLIIPTIVHDGELIPVEVKKIQPCDLKKYRIACINKNTADYHEFSVAIGGLAPKIKSAILTAPAFETKWIDECKQRFNEVFVNQDLGTAQFDWKRPKALLVPPKLVIT